MRERIARGICALTLVLIVALSLAFDARHNREADRPPPKEAGSAPLAPPRAGRVALHPAPPRVERVARGRARHRPGFRTFPLVTMLGALCGLLAETYGGWTVAAGMGGLAVVIIGGDLPLLRAGSERPGVTTEVAMLVMFAVGAYLMAGSMAVAIGVCGAVVVLLHLKPQLHSLAAKIGDRDFTAIMQFALISLVILPVLRIAPTARLPCSILSASG